MFSAIEAEKRNGVVVDHRHLGAQRADVDVADVDAVDEDRAGASRRTGAG